MKVNITDLIINSKDGSEFLMRLERYLRDSDPDFSYAKIAKACNFSSRAYVREVFLAKKKLNLRTFPQFSTGVGLTADQKNYFKTLLMLDHSEFNPQKHTAAVIRKKLEQLKERIQRAQQRKRVTVAASQNQDVEFANMEYWPIVYSSLGKGSSLVEVCRKSKLSALQVSRALESLLKAGLLRCDDSIYVPLYSHLVLDPNVFQNVIQKCFVGILNRSILESQKNFTNRNHYHFASVLSISKKNLPKFKCDLENSMLALVDAYVDPSGEQVVSLATTFL